MKRRSFLKQTTTAVAGTVLSSGVAPLLLGAEDKAGSKNVVIGQGEHRYECIHNWGELPSTIKWQTTHGVAIDSAGFVYLTHMGLGKDVMDTVVIFDPRGKFVRSFGKEWHGGGHGIDIRKEGSEEFIYLSHMSGNGPVVKTTLKGEVIWKKGFPTESGAYSDGGFYIGDGYGSHLIHQYDKAGEWVRTWGGPGKEPGKMQTPHGIWLDDRPGRKPALVVADRANARLQYFTLDGKHIGFVPDLLFPAHFDIRGEVLMVPDLHARVSLFDKANKPIVHLGDDPEWRKKVLDGFKVRTKPEEWPAGKFIHPHDACFDKDGNILVIEWVQTGRVTLLRRVS